MQSWRFSHASFHFFPYGILLALPTVLLLSLLQKNPDLSLPELSTYVSAHPKLSLLFFIWYILCLFLGKSRLILLFQTHQNRQKKNLDHMPSSWLGFTKALQIDTLFFALFLLILFIIALPSLFALFVNDASLATLLFLGELTLLPIILVGYLLREFTYFYSLLSPLTLKGSLEAASSLFSRQKFTCLTFGLHFFFVSLLFTFFFNFGMLSIVALLKQLPFLPENTMLFTVSLLVLGWYEIFRQALWFHFFQSIARPKDPTPDEMVSVTLEKKVPEISGV